MYRTICTELWTDPKVRALSCHGKLLFLYLITNPHSHLSGLYYLPLVTLLHETGMDRRGFKGGSESLIEQKLILWDQEFEQWWVVHMFDYQGRGMNTDKGVAVHLKTLHKSVLINYFLATYPSVQTYFSLSPSEGGSMGGVDFPSPVPVPDSDSEGEKIVKKRGNGHREDTPFPESFMPTDSHRKLAQARGLELNIEVLHFKGKSLEKNWRARDWNQKFMNWMLQEIKFRSRRTG